MSTKKFVATDMRSALKLVREELGADAVILSNRKVSGGIEIVASADYDAFVEQHNEKKRRANHLPEFMDDTAQPPLAGDPSKVRDFGTQGFAPSESDKAELMAALQRREQATRKFSETLQQQANTQMKSTEMRQQSTEEDQFEEPRVELSVKAQQRYGLQPDQELVDQEPHIQSEAQWNSPSDKVTANLESASEQQPVSPPEAAPSYQTPPEFSVMLGELNQLRHMMNVQMANVAWGNFSHRHPLEATVFKKLARLGLSPSLCRKLVRNLEPDTNLKTAWKQCLQELGDDLPLRSGELIENGGVFAFVGPAGVGKTTTIAKIATRFVLEHGAENLALITTDSYRIAGHEQLNTLGKILKVPVRVATEQQPLDDVLRGLSRKKLILIDTAGLSHKDQVHSEQMAMLETMGQHIQRWLVLSSTSQRRILDKAVNEYKHLNLDGCIFTKLDESASLGEALSVAIEAQLPIAYITDGQNIPDDIAQPQATRLINHAIALAKEYSMDDSQLAEFYGDAMLDTDNSLAYG